jgi:hypothetical protein
VEKRVLADLRTTSGHLGGKPNRLSTCAKRLDIPIAQELTATPLMPSFPCDSCQCESTGCDSQQCSCARHSTPRSYEPFAARRASAVGELCPRRAYGGTGIPQSDPTRRTAGRGCVRYHWCSPDRAGPGKAVRRTAMRSQCVGSHSGETPTPTSPY